MSTDINAAVESIVKILLQVGDRVVAISKDEVMTQVWDRDNSLFSTTRPDYIGKKISEIRNDSVIAQSVGLINQAFATGKNGYIEYNDPGNDKIPGYSIRILTCHPDKNFVFAVVESHTKDNAVKLVEDKWKLALDASGDGMWDANLENNTIFFSDKWHEIFGYSTDDIITLSDWSSKIYPGDNIVSQKQLDKYIAGETPVYSAEIRYRCKDGSYKWILSRGIIIAKNENGVPIRFIGTHTDINKRKFAEEDLKTSRATFANSFNYSGIGKALLEPGGKWLEVNDVICQLTEYTREELLKLHYRDITYPEDMEIDLPLIHKLLNKEIPSYTIEKRYVSKSRKVIVTLLTVTLVWDQENYPKYFVCDIVDITRKKELDIELDRKNAELEATSTNLVSKINQLDELNNIIAHNLRGKVGNIKVLSEDSEMFEQDEALKMINDCSASLLDELNMLMELAQIKLNKNIVSDQCNIRSIADNVISQLQGIIYQNNAEIHFVLEVAEILYPKIYLESILYNFISNAIKYRRKDIKTQICISTKNVDGKVQLSVKDNGIGIDLERYGDRVFKLNQVFHSGYDSKGVGLFITKSQIEAVGGSIEVKSKPNEGCEFIVTF